MPLNESIVEDAAIKWLLLRLVRQAHGPRQSYGGQVGELGYAMRMSSSSRSVNHRRSRLINVVAGKLSDSPDNSNRSSPKR